MRPTIRPADVESWGVPLRPAKELATGIEEASRRFPGALDPRGQERFWLTLRSLLLTNPAARWRFAAHLALYRLAYDGRHPEDGPGPAWVPSRADLHSSNIGRVMAARRLTSFEDFRRWSVDRREDYWSTMIRTLGIVFRTSPTRILKLPADPRHPEWLAGAQLNIAESCFNAAPNKAAILFGLEGSDAIRKMTYGQLHRLSSRIANGLDALGLHRGERIALFLPMTPEAVAAYIGIVLSGRCVVGIADAAAPPEFQKRSRIADAHAVFTVDSYLRDGKVHDIYSKVIQADGPQAIVIPRTGEPPHLARNDIAWTDFLGDRDAYDAVPGRASDYTNILFSSGTTKDPKAIPWTQTTPIKSAADAYLHQDVRPSDVLAWPTSFGWMMGPWLTYASLVNRATMALYVGATTTRAFGEFVDRARVTMLGVVPKLVRSWKTDATMERLDWHRIRVFSSTAEPSTPEEMLYLMFLDGGRPAARGEVFLVPPSIGLSTELLNYDNDEEYYDNVPKGLHGEVLRRHGDQIEHLGGGYYRHLGRIDDMININGVKTSSEEIRSVLNNERVYDSKPIAVDVDRSGQHRLVVYAVPRDSRLLGSDDFRAQLRREFQRAIKENLNPLLAHVEDVVLVPELPQAGPGKTRTMKELRSDYAARTARA